MIGWMEMLEATKGNLDRELTKQEVCFLKWLYDKHLKEVEGKVNEEEYVK